MPYYSSSEWGSLVKTAGKLIHYSNTELQYTSYPEPINWKRFFEYEGISPYGLEYSVGSLVVDPADENTIYFCSGQVNGATSSLMDYHISAYRGSLFRSTDGLATAQLIAGQDSGTDIYRFACADFGYARYVLDTAANGTQVEGWKLMARNDLFAFDDRSKVSINGKNISSVFYYLSYMRGLYRGEYDSLGKITWSIIQNEPQQYDANDDGKGSSYAGWSPSYDYRYYQYAPQEGTTDERQSYPPESDGRGGVVLDSEGNPNCDYTYDDGSNGAQPIDGVYDDTTANCYEDEIFSLGTDLAMDQVALDHGGSAILYSGYMNNQLFTHGGLFRGVESSPGVFDWVEIENPDGSGHLDVRDIELKSNSTITLADGTEATGTFYLAAGRNGVFKASVAADGSVTLTGINTGLHTRSDMLADNSIFNTSYCPSSSTCGQAISIDQADYNGTTYLLLQTSDAIFYAKDNGGTIQWRNIIGFHNKSYPSIRDGALSSGQETDWDTYPNWGGWAEGGLIDTDDGVFVVPAGPLIYKIDISSLNEVSDNYSTATWHAIHEGFGDRAGMQHIYDPVTPDTRAHFATLDYTYDSFSWDKHLKMDQPNFARTLEHGLCYQTRTVSKISDINSYLSSDDAGDSVYINSTYLSSLPISRQYYYGNSIQSSGSGKNSVLYLSAANNGSAGSGDEQKYGGVYRGTWDDASGDWTWLPATGEKNCVAKYTAGNATKNACTFICEEGTSDLPKGNENRMAVDPSDSNHVYSFYRNPKTLVSTLYETHDGGAEWVDLTTSYVNDSTGSSLTSLGYPVDGAVDPNDGKILYLSFGTGGVYARSSSTGKFIDITDAGADDNSKSLTLTKSSSTAVPTIYDIEVVDEGSQTRAYLAVNVLCDAGWAVYPSSCRTLDGGGVYTRLIGSDAAWTKLNYGAGDSEFFPATEVKVSPSDPNTIIAAGMKDALPTGGTTDVPIGLFYSQDKGVTWHKLTNSIVSAMGLASHPTNPNRFLANLEGSGIWEINLNNPDSDGDGTHDQIDDFPNDVSETLDSDGDGVGDHADAFPSDASETTDTDGDGIGDNADPSDDRAPEAADEADGEVSDGESTPPDEDVSHSDESNDVVVADTSSTSGEIENTNVPTNKGVTTISDSGFDDSIESIDVSSADASGNSLNQNTANQDSINSVTQSDDQLPGNRLGFSGGGLISCSLSTAATPNPGAGIGFGFIFGLLLAVRLFFSSRLV